MWSGGVRGRGIGVSSWFHILCQPIWSRSRPLVVPVSALVLLRLDVVVLRLRSHTGARESGSWSGGRAVFALSIGSRAARRISDRRCAWGFGQRQQGIQRSGPERLGFWRPADCLGAFYSWFRRSEKIESIISLKKNNKNSHLFHVTDVPPWKTSFVHFHHHVEPGFDVVLAGIFSANVCGDCSIAGRSSEVCSLPRASQWSLKNNWLKRELKWKQNSHLRARISWPFQSRASRRCLFRCPRGAQWLCSQAWCPGANIQFGAVPATRWPFELTIRSPFLEKIAGLVPVRSACPDFCPRAPFLNENLLLKELWLRAHSHYLHDVVECAWPSLVVRLCVAPNVVAFGEVAPISNVVELLQNLRLK